MTTVLGQWNLNHGKPYEVWGQAGVLKFPHGIALHAIQLLPLCAWLLQWLRVSSAERVIQGLIAAQWFLVLYALKQTLQGRSRVDMDAWSLLLLVAAVAWIVWPLLSIRRASVLASINAHLSAMNRQKAAQRQFARRCIEPFNGAS